MCSTVVVSFIVSELLVSQGPVQKSPMGDTVICDGCHLKGQSTQVTEKTLFCSNM